MHSNGVGEGVDASPTRAMWTVDVGSGEEKDEKCTVQHR